MEYFDALNEKKEFIGKKTRKTVHEKGLWHCSSHVWIENSKKEILCNLRDKNKDTFASCWDALTGEHLKSGENFEEAALRGLKEELGLKTNEKKLIFLCMHKRKEKYKKLKNNEFQKVFLLKTQKKLSELRKQKNEIQEIKFVPIKKLEKIMKQKKPEMKFIPKKNYYLKIIRLIKKEDKKG